MNTTLNHAPNLTQRPPRAQFNKTREDVKTWFDLLDLDDYVTFGGKA